MDFEEFCAAALSVHQLEALERWEQHARCAYEIFDKDGNRAIVIEELASVSFLLFLTNAILCSHVSVVSLSLGLFENTGYCMFHYMPNIVIKSRFSGTWTGSFNTSSCCP